MLLSIIYKSLHTNALQRTFETIRNVVDHCAWPLHRALGVTASTRASFAAYTTLDEIGTFLAALDTVPAIFGTGA